ncbi:hypothetical protein C8R47DRAFT_1229180 [Mycena vitilis]|nr:hypothetical protein C8R47DRAFT_1229180 [Mycena vitilis]
MQAGDVTESQPDVAVYAAKYPDPVFPLELLTRILSFTMEHDTVYDPCVLLRTRDSARLVHTQFKSYVDARPEFWSHIVVTIDDDSLVLSRVLESTGSSEFSLTIRMVDFSTLVAGFADASPFTVILATSFIQELGSAGARTYTREEIQALTGSADLRYINWAGRLSIPVVYSCGRIVAVLGGMPADFEGWKVVTDTAAHLLERKAAAGSFTACAEHWLNSFTTAFR